MNIKHFLKFAYIAISLVSLFIVVCFSVNINKVEIIKYQKNDDFVYNYNGCEYYKICEENEENFSRDLYNNYQNYLPTDYEKVSNSNFEKCYVMGNSLSYVFPETVRVIYDNSSPIIIVENGYIDDNEYYLIAEN